MTSLTLVRRIAARPSIVFDALTTPDGIACWWGPDDGPVLVAETDIRVGGRFRVRRAYRTGADVPHDLRIRIHRHERPGVLFFRRPQDEPGGAERGHAMPPARPGR